MAVREIAMSRRSREADPELISKATLCNAVTPVDGYPSTYIQVLHPAGHRTPHLSISLLPASVICNRFRSWASSISTPSS